MKILPQLQGRIAFIVLLLLGACVRLPEGVEPVANFEVSRYLGTWYEIARLDHSFERGLSQVTAQYSLGEGGAIRVINRGYDQAAKKWKEARGRAYFVESPQTGRLKVSFFGPFYGGYNIVELDQEQYSYALVCGPSRSYLWILSRTSTLNEATLQALVARAKALGFDTDSLIYVEHEPRAGRPGAQSGP
jgi:apolipoprotein D and lipocalin family protein